MAGNTPVRVLVAWGIKKGLRFSSEPLILLLEAAPGFEPGISALQAVALPLGQAALSGAGNGI